MARLAQTLGGLRRRLFGRPLTEPEPVAPGEVPPRHYVRTTGSVSRRMLLVATAWIMLLLVGGGIALDRVLVTTVTKNFDDQLDYLLKAMIFSAELDQNGDVMLNRELADQRFLEYNSGAYWQISGRGHEAFPSRSLWDQKLKVDQQHSDTNVHVYDSRQLPGQLLRVAERDAVLPGSNVRWRFQVAQSRETLDGQIAQLRRTLVRSFVLLGLGLIIMVALQTWYGLLPLRRVRQEIARLRAGESTRVEGAMPAEVAPMVEELNALVEHNDRQAEEARRHAGNLAHALKTPLSVMLAEARSQPGSLADVVARQAEAMRDHVDHHLRRARAAARAQGSGERTLVEPVLDELARTLERIFRSDGVTIDWRAPEDLCFQGERQDLLEVAGNVMENACKWSNGRVRVSASAIAPDRLRLVVEDDGPGLPPDRRDEVLKRGTRLDENAPGSGLGLSIVDELARAYGGSIILSDSPLGGLMVKVVLPRAEN